MYVNATEEGAAWSVGTFHAQWRPFHIPAQGYVENYTARRYSPVFQVVFDRLTPGTSLAFAGRMTRDAAGAEILLVEDNEDYLLLMNLVLQEAGYTVDSATCAEDALRMMERRRYRLLLTDYSLPGYSGLWLLSQAFNRTLVPADAAFIITGDPDAPGIDGVAPVVPVVPKPVNFDGLLDQIKAALARTPQHQSSHAAA